MNNGLIILAILGAIIIAGILLSFEKTKKPSANGSSDTEKQTVGDESGLKK
jgi:uncharacterized protein YpmB